MNKHKKIALDVLFIVSGSMLFALALNLFIVPNGLTSGGITGVAIIINHLIGFPVGITTIILNIPLLLFGMKYLGRKFVVSSLVGLVLSSVFIDATSFLKPLTEEPLLAALYGGIIMGTGLGLVFLRGATTGGADIIGRLLRLVYKNTSIGRLMFIVDALVLIGASIVFENPNTLLYSIIMLFASVNVMDSVIYGLDYAKVAYVISNKEKELTKILLKELSRGVTILHGEGAYSKEEKRIIMCAVKKQQISKLKEVVKSIDPDAFIILTEAREIVGMGFKDANSIEI